MKAVKKPIPITVEEFQPEKQPWPVNVQTDLKGGYEVYNRLHNGPIKLKPGDMVNVTNLDDTYPIDREVFEKTYTLVPDTDVIHARV